MAKINLVKTINLTASLCKLKIGDWLSVPYKNTSVPAYYILADRIGIKIKTHKVGRCLIVKRVKLKNAK